MLRVIGFGQSGGPRRGRLAAWLALPAVALAWLLAPGGRGQVAPSLSFVHTDQQHLILDSTGRRLVLRGVNLGGLEFGGPFGAARPARYPGVRDSDFFVPGSAEIRRIRELRFNAVRLPIEWARLVPAWEPARALPAALDATYLGFVRGVVQTVEAEGLYVVLDLHDFLKYWAAPPAPVVCVDSSEPHQALLARTWQLLAAQFADSRAVMLDLMNEPVRRDAQEPCGSGNWPQIAQRAIDAIRAVDRNHLIFVQGVNYSLASRWPIENSAPFVRDSVTPPRLVYSAHVYFDFSETSRYDAPGEALGPVGNWPQYVRDRLMPFFDWSAANKQPIVIGETNVPCGSQWGLVLDHAFRRFFDPLQVSTFLWNYADPGICPLRLCALNIAACSQNSQTAVLDRFPVDRYVDPPDISTFIPIPFESVLFSGGRVNPWDGGEGIVGDVAVDFCDASRPVAGSCSLRAAFPKNDFSSIKFIHRNGLDTRRFTTVTFQIYLSNASEPDLKLWTTSPRIGSGGPEDPVYPAAFRDQPNLREFLPAFRGPGWHTVQIPIGRLVNPNGPSIVNGLAFQNVGVAQGAFYLNHLALENSSPRVSPAGVVNAATSLEGAVAPGELVTIYGTNLGPAEGVHCGLDAGGSAPTLCGGTTVTFDGAPAALTFVGSNQVNLQAPYSVAGKSSTRVRVVAGAGDSNVLQLGVVLSSPGLFTLPGQNDQAIALNQDASLNSQQLPAPRGSIVTMYATGEGQTDPAGVDGQPRAAYVNPQLPCSVQVGGAAAETLYCSSAPGFVGLMQVNVRVPGDPGALGSAVKAPVAITIGNNTSPPGAGIWIR
jgi:uncharacterized protein (TIGR03437 family)